MPHHLVGVVSDTHGLVRPAVLDVLQGVEAIIHAGDVGKPEVLASLRTIAPVMAVRGNVDRAAWADVLPVTTTVTIGPVQIALIHNIAALPTPPVGIHAVIYGHSHIPAFDWRGGILYLNPGSIGPRRFTLPTTLALLEVRDDGTLTAEIIELEV